jgi:hypothetical protein
LGDDPSVSTNHAHTHIYIHIYRSCRAHPSSAFVVVFWYFFFTRHHPSVFADYVCSIDEIGIATFYLICRFVSGTSPFLNALFPLSRSDDRLRPTSHLCWIHHCYSPMLSKSACHPSIIRLPRSIHHRMSRSVHGLRFQNQMPYVVGRCLSRFEFSFFFHRSEDSNDSNVRTVMYCS